MTNLLLLGILICLCGGSFILIGLLKIFLVLAVLWCIICLCGVIYSLILDLFNGMGRVASWLMK